ncbi:MAG: hypothetical protein AAB224_10335 [Gemmatimonadota bacterium]
MTPYFRTSLLAVLAAAPLAAQQPAAQPGAAACTIEFDQPKELLTHYTISRAKIIQMPVGDDRAKLLRDVMKSLGSPKVAAANPQGTNLFAGQMLIAWLMQPNFGPTATRAQLNYGEPKDATIDLARTADSLFSIIEKEQPGCSTETAPWRAAKPWLDRINAALRLASTNPDSAELMANASLILNRSAPYAERVLASVAQSRNDQLGMLKHLEAALALTANDTIYADDRRSVQFQIGQVSLEAAEKQPEPARTEILRRGVAAMIALATESPGAEVTPYALTGLGIAASSLKDSTFFTKCFEMVDAAVAAYNDLSTLQAAVCASRNGKTADAVRMFQATLAKNPNSRDALYNAAALLYELRKGTEMLPLVTRLVELDPSNPDNVSLFAYAYNVLNEQSKPAAVVAPSTQPGAKPSTAKPAAAPAPVPVAPAEKWVDSVTKYMKLSDEMPHRVQMTEFTRFAEKATLNGDIENRGKAAKTYTLEVEFLDLAGAVLDKQTATVGPVDPSKLGSFALTSNKPKIVAWRYAPLK